MKRLALMLGSILLVSGVAVAKEIVVQPDTMIEEPVAVIKEVGEEEKPEEVLVMMKEPTEFKTTGWVRAQAKYYGKGEHKSVEGNYVRTEITGSFSLTENDEFYFRNRLYQNLNSVESTQVTSKENSRTDLRWWHNFGKISDTKIGVKTQLHYEQRDKYKRATAYLELEFSEYMNWTPEWFKNTMFSVQPKFRHVKYDDADSNYYNRVGADLQTSWSLPLGFNFDYAFYFNAEDYSSSSAKKKGYNKANDFTTEFYLSNRWKLAQSMDEKTKLTFGFIGGLDDYGNYQHTDIEGKNQNYYEYYAELDLRVDHKINNSVGVFAYVGGEYRNFNDNSVSSAKDWTWRPMGGAGFKATF